MQRCMPKQWKDCGSSDVSLGLTAKRSIHDNICHMTMMWKLKANHAFSSSTVIAQVATDLWRYCISLRSTAHPDHRGSHTHTREF